LTRRAKIFWLIVGAGLVIGFLWLVPFHGEICKEAAKADDKTCPVYRLPPFTFIWIGKILDALGGGLTAVATIAIAWFTYSLRQSTDGLKESGEKQIRSMRAIAMKQDLRTREAIEVSNRSAEVAERALTELEAPFTAIKIIDTGLIKKTGEIGHDFAILQFSVTNDGRTPARLVELVDKTILVEIEGSTPLPMNLDYRSRNTMPYGVISPPNSESQPFTQHLLMNHMNELAADTLILKNKTLFFYGFVRYETIFKQRYRMGFCYFYDRYSNRWILTGDENYNYLTKEG
jgi:hypothetical protein